MRYYIIAGEASGDLHGGNLLQALKDNDPDCIARGWGGDHMQAAGMTLVRHYRELAFMGFVEVVRNLPAILRNMAFAKQDILNYRPDVLILIDYPGFNLRIAKWAHALGIRVYYFISPQLWAWHQSRVRQVKAYVDKMFVVLPFEVDFYKQHGISVDYEGHPLLDALPAIQEVADFRQQHGLDDRPIIALLPGSRKQEIERMLPLMKQVAISFPAYQFVVAEAPSQPSAFYDAILQDAPIHRVQQATYQLLQCSRAALVTSGTATLEAALIGVPQVVCYKGGSVSYAIGKRLVKVKYISLVNLIMDKVVVAELIQHDCSVERITAELQELLQEEVQNRMKRDYVTLRNKLGAGGASTRVAQRMINYLKADIPTGGKVY